MKKEKGLFKKMFSFLIYKEKEDIPDFYIPEINEGVSRQSSEVENNNESEKNKKENDNKEQENRKSESREDLNNVILDTIKKREKIKVIKPIPLTDFKKKKDSDTDIDKTKKIYKSNHTSKDGIFRDINLNIKKIKKEFNYPVNKDIVIREFSVNRDKKAFIVYMDGMVDRVTINNFILSPILENAEKFRDYDSICQLDYIYENVLQTHQIKKIENYEEIINEIIVGDTGVFIDGCNYMIFCETKGFEKRNVSSPQVESIVRGSQEAFNENLRTNITLLRRIIKDKHLTTEFLSVGSRNINNVAIAYLDGVINPAIVEEVKRRLNGIKTDHIGSAGMIEQFIEDNPFSIIPTIMVTERPDRTSSHIIEGKIAIITDGTPFAIVAPITVGSLIHSPEDASLRWQYAVLLRFIRFFALFVAVLLPGLYVALTNFHKEMIPTDLLIAIAKAKENVPFPTIIEVILMEISFELIREAGIRIPGIVGNTIGIIGALILGQAAVQANLVSPVMIIIVAFTGLGNFAIPDFSLAFGIRIIRSIFIIAGAIMGFYGISLSIVTMGFVLVNMKSFGVPFFSPIAPKTTSSKDLIIRWPIWKQEFRPDYLNTLNERRQPKISRQWIREKPVSERNKEGKDE